MLDRELDDFVSTLIDEKRLTGLTPEGKEQIARELKDLLIAQINRAVLAELPNEKLDELDYLMNQEGFGENSLQDFIRNSGVDIPKITAKTLLYFKAFYLGDRR